MANNGTERENDKKIILQHNRINTETVMDLLQEKTPINVITATYLDPRRYHKYIHIWLYLLMLFGAQVIQYTWIASLGRQWREKLSRWLQSIKNLNSPFSQQYKWFTFKEDYLPHSSQLFLSSFADGIRSGSVDFNVPPLVTMGASYVEPNVPNVVFLYDKKIQYDTNKSQIQELPEIDSDVQHNTIAEIANRVVKILNDENYKDLMNSNYQEWEARNIPVWKSRFIPAPEKLPSDEQLQNEISENDLNIEYDDPPPLKDEFQAYLFEEFLNDMQPEITKRYMTENERTRYILQDIERNREEIIRKAIQRAKEAS
jgi:hypothetical protein